MDRRQQQKQQHCQNDHNHLHHQQNNQQQHHQNQQHQQQQQQQHFHRRPPDVEEALSSMLWTPYERTPTDSSSSSDEDEKLNKNLFKKIQNNNKTPTINSNNGAATYYNIFYNNLNYLQPTTTTTTTINNHLLNNTSNSVALTNYVPSIYRNKNYNRYNNNNNNNRIISDNNNCNLINNNRFNFPYYNDNLQGHNSPIRIDINEPPSYESLYHNNYNGLTTNQISNSQITQTLSTVNIRQRYDYHENDDNNIRNDRTNELRMVHSFTDDFITHQENIEQILPIDSSSTSELSNATTSKSKITNENHKLNKIINLVENIEQTENNITTDLKNSVNKNSFNNFSLLKNEPEYNNQFNKLNSVQGNEKIDQKIKNNENYNKKKDEHFIFDQNNDENNEISNILVDSKIINQIKHENYIENNNNNDFTIKNQNEPFLPKLMLHQKQQQQQQQQQQKSTKVSKPSIIENIYGNNDLPTILTTNLVSPLNNDQQQKLETTINNKATPQTTKTIINVERAAQTEPVVVTNNLSVGQFSREKEVVSYGCINTVGNEFNTLSVRDLSSSIKLLINTQSLLQKHFFITLNNNNNSIIPVTYINNNSNLQNTIYPVNEIININNNNFINNVDNIKNNIVKFNDVDEENEETISESSDYDNNKVGVLKEKYKNYNQHQIIDNFNVVHWNKIENKKEKINRELAMRLNVPGVIISSSITSSTTTTTAAIAIENQLNDEKFYQNNYMSEQMALTNINNNNIKIPKTSSIFLPANSNNYVAISHQNVIGKNQNVIGKTTTAIAAESDAANEKISTSSMTILTPSLGAIMSTTQQPSLTIQVNQNNSFSNILNNNNNNTTESFLITKNNILNNNTIENQILSLPTPISGVNVINCYNTTVPNSNNNNSLKNFINSTNISSCANNLNNINLNSNKNISVPSGSDNDNRDLNRVQNNNVITSTTLCNIDSNNDNINSNHLNINNNNNNKNKNGLPVSSSIIPKLSSTPERQFISTECQTDDIIIDQLTSSTSTPTRNPNSLNKSPNNNTNNNNKNGPSVNNNNTSCSQTTDALIAREQRRRERRERRLHNRNNNRPTHPHPHPHPHPHLLSSPPNHHPPPPPIHHYSNAAVNTAGLIRPMLPDILHSHFPPPYTTLSMSNPHHPGALNNGTGAGGGPSPPQGIPSRHSQQPLPTTSLIAGPIISAVPLAAAATAVNDGRFTIPLPVIRRSPSERSGKGCCGQWFAGPPLRALIAVVALGGVACALGGAALGATGLAGPPTSHLTAALLMIGVGVILVTVSGAAWRMTAPGGPPCLGLGSTVDLGRCGRRPCSSRGGAPHGLLYPEFQHRPPPPSYQASMQEYRLRLLLLDRDRQNGVVRGGSPPPTYRSHAGSLLRTPLTTNTRNGNGGRHYPGSISGPGSEYSLPPSYNSRNINNTTTQATINNNTSSTINASTAITTTIPRQNGIILRDDDSIESNNLLEINSNDIITSALITSAPKSSTDTNNKIDDLNQNKSIMSIGSNDILSSTNFMKNSSTTTTSSISPIEIISSLDNVNNSVTNGQLQKNVEKFNPRVLANINNKNKNNNNNNNINNFVIFGSSIKTNQKDDRNSNEDIKNGNNRKNDLVTIVTISASQGPEESSTTQSSEMEILAHL